MTTAMTTTPHARARTRPVPWTRLAWVAFRQHRAALTGVTILLGVIAVYLAAMGQQIHDAYAKYAACHPAGPAACQQLKQALDSYYGSQQGSVMTSGLNAQSVPFLLLALPVLIGAFTGAPVLARELETGTFRFAWTQGAGRLRWAVAKLVLLAVTLTAAAFAFSLLFSWYFQPFIAEGNTSKFPIQVFGNSGAAFATWTLLAFAMAAFAGAVIRRTVPAMAATLAVWIAAYVTTVDNVRQDYQAPLTATGNTPPGGSSSWILGGGWIGPGGQRVTGPLLQFAPASIQNSTDPTVVNNWLNQHQDQFGQWWSYQPGSRFWTFQAIEGGWLLALSLILLAATIWLVRRRAA
jgi:ABC-type transport system involved in multi-copper enzyme maturation permease subunit